MNFERLTVAGVMGVHTGRSLTLSVRTVDNHLNRAYAKLGDTSAPRAGRRARRRAAPRQF